jgi:hypothetical protein
MASKKYGSLVRRLVDKTNRNELGWRESPMPEVYQVSFSRYSLKISEVQEARQDSYVISVLNSDGTVIDSFSDADLDVKPDQLGLIRTEFSNQLTVNIPFSALLRDLYQKARRQALGADKALDEILNELGNN